MEMKFKIGDAVTVRTDLLIGSTYRNESDYRNSNPTVFSAGMVRLMGQDAIIIDIKDGRYVLNIAQNNYFVDGMILEKTSIYGIPTRMHEIYSKNADNIINKLINEYYKSKVNEALDNNNIEDFNFYSALLNNLKSEVIT